MRKSIIALLVVGGFAATVASAGELQVKEDAPERYVVEKGDTLWGIAGRFLSEPWRWPEIWRMNQEQIKNPHRIYPGDVIVLDTSDGGPRLRLLNSHSYGGRPVVKLSPTARVEQREPMAIPAISPADIQPFLSEPLVVTPDSLESAARIVAQEDNRVIIGVGSRAYVSGINGPQKVWSIYRQGRPLIDPDTNAVLGHEAVYLGDARVIRPGDPATVEIIKSKQEIRRDDRLLPAANVELSNIVPRAPQKEIRARIVSAYGGVSETGRGSIVALNRGQRDGLEVGHVLALARFGNTVIVDQPQGEGAPSRYITLDKCLRPGAKVSYGEPYDVDKAYGPCPPGTEGPKSFEERKPREARGGTPIKLPDERYGLVMVFRTFDTVSYGLVLQSRASVHVADLAETPTSRP